MTIIRILVLISLTLQPPHIQASVNSLVTCQALFSRNNGHYISYEKAAELVRDATEKEFFDDIPKKLLKQVVEFDHSHPDRSHGFSSRGMRIGILNNQIVLIKSASRAEIQLAYAFHRLGIGPKFHGTIGSSIYVISFIPNAVLIKSNHFDRRMKDFISRGFRLDNSSKEKIRTILNSLARIGINVSDPNFLVTMSGEVYLIDPGKFSISDYELVPTNSNLINEFEGQFKRIEELQSLKSIE